MNALDIYEHYLNIMQAKIDKHFERQKFYIFCKAGCDLCCRNAEFPYSQLEAEYLISGYFKLDEETRKVVHNKIKKVIEDKKNSLAEKFLYDCPFLIDNKCCLYKYRGFICRSFGLLTRKNDNTINVPFCHCEGLNYSNIYDEKTNKFSEEKFNELDTDIYPETFKVDYNFMTGEFIEKNYNIKFGDKKPLIDWLMIFLANESI